MRACIHKQFYHPPCHLKVRRLITVIYIFNNGLEIEKGVYRGSLLQCFVPSITNALTLCPYLDSTHTHTLCLIDQTKAHNKKLYYNCFVDFRKAFDTIPTERLFDKLKTFKIPDDKIWAIYALYEQVSECVWCPGGLSNCFTSTIGVKQGSPYHQLFLGYKLMRSKNLLFAREVTE